MIEHSASSIARLAGGRLLRPTSDSGGPSGATSDSRELVAGDLFVGLDGRYDRGDRFAAQAIRAGAWGALVAERCAGELADLSAPVILADDPLLALKQLGSARRSELEHCLVVGVTGSAGKTSTKDILLALIEGQRRAHGSRGTANDAVGVSATVIGAPRRAELVVTEMATRGFGQIAELARIAVPHAAVILNVGSVHLGPLRSRAGVAAAKAELIEALPSGAPCVVPAGEPLLQRYLRRDLQTITFGAGGDVRLIRRDGSFIEIDAQGERIDLELSFSESHRIENTLAAVAMARAIGVEVGGPLSVEFGPMRGEVLVPMEGVALVNDCFNANPLSMEAALSELAVARAQRRIAVLGEMGDLGKASERLHRHVGERAAALGVDLLITVGPTARAYEAGFHGQRCSVPSADAAASVLLAEARAGDRILVKGSRDARLERVVLKLGARRSRS